MVAECQICGRELSDPDSVERGIGPVCAEHAQEYGLDDIELSENEVLIFNIEIDDDIYPRKQKSKKTIESYVEALKVGAIFPPLTIQRLRSNGNEKVVALDGYHRKEAYLKFNELEDYDPVLKVRVENYRNEVLDKQENLEELRIAAVQFNLKHGIRITDNDIQYQAIRIVEDRPVEKLHRINKDLADKFGLSENYMSELIGSLVRQKKASRDSLILRLSKLGHKQTRIADSLGIDQSSISKIMKNFATEEIHNLYSKGTDINKIADTYRLDIPTLWSIILEGKKDLERFEEFGESKYSNEKPKPFNVWNFTKLDPRLGHRHEMNIPGQISMNVLYYFTKQNDLIVDPMAGGGSTIDSCLVLNRKCLAYDIDPQRKDIQKNDILEGLPEETKNCDLIFLDPPYGNLVNGPENSFYEFIEKIAVTCYDTVRPKGIVILIMCDKTKDNYEPYISESYNIFKETGFTPIQRISTPLSTQSANGDEVNKALENRKLLGRDRVIHVFRRSK